MSKLTAAVLGLALALPPLAANAQMGADEKAIRDAVARWNAMANARDIEGVVGLYAPDAYFMAPNAPAASGPALREALKGLLAAPDMKATVTPQEIRVAASRDLAYERGAYTIHMGGAPADVGKYIV